MKGAEAKGKGEADLELVHDLVLLLAVQLAVEEEGRDEEGLGEPPLDELERGDVLKEMGGSGGDGRNNALEREAAQ